MNLVKICSQRNIYHDRRRSFEYPALEKESPKNIFENLIELRRRNIFLLPKNLLNAYKIVSKSKVCRREEISKELWLHITAMKEVKVKPRTAIFHILLGNANGQGEIAKIRAHMKETGIVPNVATYTTLLNKVHSQEKFLKIRQEMKQARIVR